MNCTEQFVLLFESIKIDWLFGNVKIENKNVYAE